jgi:hypothetical protein
MVIKIKQGFIFKREIKAVGGVSSTSDAGPSGIIDGIKVVRHSLFSRNYLGAPLANTFRREAYEKLGGFDPRYHYIVDYDFYIKLALAGKIYIIHEPLNYFRIRNDSNTGEVLGGDKGNLSGRAQEAGRKVPERSLDFPIFRSISACSSEGL